MVQIISHYRHLSSSSEWHLTRQQGRPIKPQDWLTSSKFLLSSLTNAVFFFLRVSVFLTDKCVTDFWEGCKKLPSNFKLKARWKHQSGAGQTHRRGRALQPWPPCDCWRVSAAAFLDQIRIFHVAERCYTFSLHVQYTVQHTVQYRCLSVERGAQLRPSLDPKQQ